MNDIQEAQERARSQLATASDPLQKILRPAFELVQNRFGPDDEQKLYGMRCKWVDAGNAVGWNGAAPRYDRMVALVGSPIWQELGKMGLGEDYPPYEEDCYFGWRTVTKKEWEELNA